MRSEQLQAAFDMVKQGKAAGARGVWPPAEAIDQVRAGSDQMMEALIAQGEDTGMSVEEGEVGGTKGWWYRLPDNAPNKRATR